MDAINPATAIDGILNRSSEYLDLVETERQQKQLSMISAGEKYDIHKQQIAQSTEDHAPNEFEHCHKLVSFSVYMTWVILMIHAYIREFLRSYGFEKNKAAVEREQQRNFTPLYTSFEPIYARNCYKRVLDVFERPISGVPGALVKLADRKTDDHCWNFKLTGGQTEVINMGSYNYLGFAENDGECSERASSSIDDHGLSVCTTVQEQGMTVVQQRLEKLVAQFLGVEEAICFSMGFATNSMNILCLADKHSLIISDQYNHASIVLGCRMSGASTRIFKHNDLKSLEKVIRSAILNGNPKTLRSYNKIIIVVEGIYSMEGSICNLPAIIALKKKYNCYLYLDEAHSIGAIGKTGRGTVDYWGCNPADIDVLMGTFTKSFGGAGGYMAGKKVINFTFQSIISHIRANSPTGLYSLPMSPPVAEQVHSAMSIIMGHNGNIDEKYRLDRLARNTRYFRLRLKQMGFIVYGSDDSPVVPIMLYYPTKCGLWGRLMLERRIGVVVVSFPATEMTESRCRICISAAHSKEVLDYVLAAIEEVGEISCTKHSRRVELFRDMNVEW